MMAEGRINGAGSRNRTRDLLITNQLLYQLSYAGLRRIIGPAMRARNRASQLLDHLQARPAARRRPGAVVVRRTGLGLRRRDQRGGQRRRSLERQAMPVFLGEDSCHRGDRHRDLARSTAETRRELDPVVADLQIAGGVGTYVEHDFAVLDVLRRYLGGLVHLHRNVRSQPIVAAPLVDRADQVGGGRGFLHLRITFSEAVSASMKAGRLNSRSAYFIRGAACFWVPPSIASMLENSSFSKRNRNSRARARITGSAGISCGCGKRSSMYSLMMFDSYRTRSRSTSTGRRL